MTTGLTRTGWLAFVLLASIEFLTVMDASVVNIALPVIQQELGFTSAGLAWVVNAYLIPFAGFLLFAGRLADVVGRRPLFICGTFLFTLGSVACGLSVESWHLLGGRVLQGLGAALVMPAALALITDLFPEGPARHRALALYSSMAGVAAPVGLLLGGVLAAKNWHWIFWVNVPFGLLVLLGAVKMLPRSKSTRIPLDWLGALTATGALSLLTASAAQLGHMNWATPRAFLIPLLGIVLGFVFIYRQRTANTPLIPPDLMARPNIRVGNIIFTLVGTVLLSTFFLATLYLQGVRNLSAEQVTFFYLPVPLGMLAGTQLASRFIPVLGARKVLTAGLLIQVVMLACWLSTSSQTSPLLLGFTVPVTLWAIGLGMSIVSSFVICTSGIAGSQAGTASGLATTSYQGGGAFGLALMAALATTNSDQLQVALAGHHRAILGLVAVTLVAFLLTRSLPQDQPASRHEKRAA